MHGIPVFPLDTFFVYFEEFDNPSAYSRASVQSCGLRAMHYIKNGICGMPLPNEGGDRDYALFLLTAHILTLKKQSADALATGGDGNVIGRVKKAIVGSVTVDTDSPNGYLSNDISYWLSQTQYGIELLAYLEMSVPIGTYINNRSDSVRVLT